MVLAGEVWHYWIGVPLAIASILVVIGTVVAYFRKMNALKYPKR
jgi:hypothetical protein